MIRSFFVGLDLGQAQDYTALAVLQQADPPTPPGGWKPDVVYRRHYHLRHLERFPLGTSYPDIVESVAKLMRDPRLGHEPMLCVDATGVGAPVVDLLKAKELVLTPVVITGGDQITTDDRGWWRVPKREIVTRLQVLLQERRLQIANKLSHAPTFVRELEAYRVKIDPLTAHDSYGAAREGDHDDLVLAVALANWKAHKWGGDQFDPEFAPLSIQERATLEMRQYEQRLCQRIAEEQAGQEQFTLEDFTAQLGER